jgi:major type 1 subunit fimbrin (pilin)
MRTKLFASTLLLAGCVAAPSASADSGTINFFGQLTDATCEVRGGTSGSPSFAVQLPTISAASLDPGVTLGHTFFRMELHSCSAVANGVKAYFESGAAVDPMLGTLPTNLPDVHLALFDVDSRQILVGADSQRTDNLLWQPDEVMHYQVAYRNVGSVAAVPGLVSASVTYSLHYP